MTANNSLLAGEPLATTAKKSQTLNRSFSIAFFADILAIIEASIVCLLAPIAKFSYVDLYLQSFDSFEAYLELGVFAGVINVFVFRKYKLYAADQFRNYAYTPLSLIVISLSTTFLLLLAFLYLLKTSDNFSRVWMVLWFALSVVAIGTERMFVRAAMERRARQGKFKIRVAVYGTGQLGGKVVRNLLDDPQNFEFSGYYCDVNMPRDAENRNAQGGMEALVAAARQNRFDRVICALPITERDRLGNVISHLSALPIEVDLYMDSLSTPLRLYGFSSLGNNFLLQLQRRPISDRNRAWKAASDYILAGLALLALFPLFAIIAAAIKLESKGPVFFRQRRHGFNHEVIHVTKFRTMTTTDDGPVIKQAEKGDKRITKVGAFLRRSSLDELPQLLNVIRGEMSIVGPRPHALAHNEYYSTLVEHYAARHRVKPGITGWAQVNGFRGETRKPSDMMNRVKYDLYYIDNWSLLFDLRILLTTVFAVVAAKNAH